MQTLTMKTLLRTILILAIIPSFTASSAHKTGPVTVAVLDTGFGYHNLGHDAKLCRYGHKDFTSDNVVTKEYATAVPIPVDYNGHGTNVVGLIGKQLPVASNYCIVVIKVYDKKGRTGNSIRAIRYAADIGADFINFSAGGTEPDYDEEREVRRYLSHGGRFIAAAGNEGKLLSKQGYYPAMYPGVVAVGNLTHTREIETHSNYGRQVSRWEVGEAQEAWGITMTGTSQATAVATGKLVANALEEQRYER